MSSPSVAHSPRAALAGLLLAGGCAGLPPQARTSPKPAAAQSFATTRELRRAAARLAGGRLVEGLWRSAARRPDRRGAGRLAGRGAGQGAARQGARRGPPGARGALPAADRQRPGRRGEAELQPRHPAAVRAARLQQLRPGDAQLQLRARLLGQEPQPGRGGGVGGARAPGRSGRGAADALHLGRQRLRRSGAALRRARRRRARDRLAPGDADARSPTGSPTAPTPAASSKPPPPARPPPAPTSPRSTNRSP